MVRVDVGVGIVAILVRGFGVPVTAGGVSVAVVVVGFVHLPVAVVVLAVADFVSARVDGVVFGVAVVTVGDPVPIEVVEMPLVHAP